MANIMPSVVVNWLFWTLLMPNAVVVYGSGHQQCLDGGGEWPKGGCYAVSGVLYPKEFNSRKFREYFDPPNTHLKFRPLHKKKLRNFRTHNILNWDTIDLLEYNVTQTAGVQRNDSSVPEIFRTYRIYRNH